MIRCPHCGVKIAAADLFCPHCHLAIRKGRLSKMMTRLLSRPHRTTKPPEIFAAATLPVPPTPPTPTPHSHLTKQLEGSIRQFLRQERIITVATYSLIPLVLLAFMVVFGFGYLHGKTQAAASALTGTSTVTPPTATATTAPPSAAGTSAPNGSVMTPTTTTAATPTATVGEPKKTATDTPVPPTPMPTATALPQLVSAINAGGNGSGTYQPDIDFSGTSTVVTTTHPIDTSLVGATVPASIYQDARTGMTFVYTISQLTPSAMYTVRLDFAEIAVGITLSGQRQFNVIINNQAPVLANFDIIAQAGAPDKAIARSFTVTADATGQISIGFVGTINQAIVSGIAITTAP